MIVNVTDKKTVLKYVSDYIACGWHVFPIAYGGKIPLRGSNGFKDATIDVETIKEWFECEEPKNIGIRTGKISNLVVVDIDKNDRKDGFGSVEALGGLPETYTVRTRQGLQFYFSYPSNGLIVDCTENLGKHGGIDIRGNNGYVVAPPSLHPSGITYCIENNLTLAELPKCIIDLYNNRPANKKRTQKKKSKSKQQSTPKEGGFVIMHNELIKGMAHQKLSGSQQSIYMYMRSKCGKKDRGNYSINTSFECPYSLINEDLGYDGKTIARAIPALIQKGFIELVRQGGSRNKNKWSSIYKISEKWNWN